MCYYMFYFINILIPYNMILLVGYCNDEQFPNVPAYHDPWLDPRMDMG